MQYQCCSRFQSACKLVFVAPLSSQGPAKVKVPKNNEPHFFGNLGNRSKFPIHCLCRQSFEPNQAATKLITFERADSEILYKLCTLLLKNCV